jgi:hypothetical protein
VRECPFLVVIVHSVTINFVSTLFIAEFKAGVSGQTRITLCIYIENNSQGGDKLARSNYQFKKRQKELERKKKKEEKRQLKLDKTTIKPEDNQDQSHDEDENLSA